ncbi:MAG: tetratricopeptide repeat protein [Prolixibacteraceae bacterium]|jgi:tetratricopeptide (TPR) repeat protein|nr:tetratricopeptide repeat protein [Prolixibacteraceae bacterium]
MRKHTLFLSIFISLFLLFCTTFTSGITPQSQTKQATLNQVIELYSSSNYIAAERVILDILDNTNSLNPIAYDLDYYRLMCQVKQNNRTAENDITSYLKNTQGSPWENQLWYELSKLQFSNKRYRLASRTFLKVDKRLLSKNDKDDFAFYKGYSNFEAGNLKAAAQSFFEVKKSNSIYASSATYYWGYINYLEGNYETALDEFSKLENNRNFSGFIRFYTTQIYYLQEKYEKVITYGEKLVASAPAPQKNELLKIVGDSFYETGKYISAVKYLDAYKGVGGKKAPEDYFRLGYCYYQMKDYKDAIKSFEKASFKKDLMAQNAFYHLADCQLQLDNKNKARIAFQEASKYSFDPRIEEDALFNYAKLTYELSYSPFNETIKAFDQYIVKYPDSERNDAAFNYLVKVYMTTRNYRDAINSIDKIKNQSSSIKEAYQRLTYYRGLELLNDRLYTDALKYFNLSLAKGQYNRTFKAQALYWSAEINYRIKKYQNAIDLFSEFQSSPGAYSLPEYTTAYYNTAYCYFNQKKYEEAATWFRKYLDQSSANNKMKADAANRVGDYYYLIRKYTEAIQYYEQSHQMNSYDPDYALFQQATCYGLERDYSSKINELNKLVDQYPRSSFIDDALYEIAKSHERIGDLDKATAGYNQLIRELQQSNFSKKALLQLGLIYYNKSNYKTSLDNYKKVVENYPNSNEAKAALVGIKNNYIDMNNVDGYFIYTKSLGDLVSISANEQDSTFYLAAEKSYMDGLETASTQLELYLKRFPDANFKVNALFYLAETNYKNENYSEALNLYEEVAEQPDHIFTEQALIKAGELTYNAEKYNSSFDYFTRLEQIANTKWNLLKARLGIMRTNYELNKYAATVKTAITLLVTDNVTDLMIREANYKMAKSYYLMNEEDEAFKYFKLLTTDTKSIEGAESKYFIAQILYNKKKLDECENEVMDFISKNTPHQYWLAKSFILLSDVYLAKDDLFQAKHTLNSIIDNYTDIEDGIINEAKKKKAILEEKEKETILTTEASDSTQIN